MCKFKQLILISNLVISGALNASSDRATRIAENLASLRQCERVIAPNYVLKQRSELDSCIENNGTEFSAIAHEFRANREIPEINYAIDQRNQIIAGLSKTYDEANFYDKAYISLGNTAGVLVGAITACGLLELIKSGAKR